MITSPKKHKDVKIRKVETKKFKNAKKFKRYKSSKEVLSLENKIHFNGQKNSIQSSGIANLINNIEKKYSLQTNNILLKNQKNIESSKKLNFLKFNQISPGKCYKIEEEKNNEEQSSYIDVNAKLGGKKIDKKKISKKLKHCKSLYNNKYNKFNIFKEIKNIKARGSQDNKSNLVFKDKKNKKDKKSKIIKEEKKTDDEDNDKQNNENYVNNSKFKFLCCCFS